MRTSQQLRAIQVGVLAVILLAGGALGYGILRYIQTPSKVVTKTVTNTPVSQTTVFPSCVSRTQLVEAIQSWVTTNPDASRFSEFERKGPNPAKYLAIDILPNYPVLVNVYRLRDEDAAKYNTGPTQWSAARIACSRSRNDSGKFTFTWRIEFYGGAPNKVTNLQTGQTQTLQSFLAQ